ncbi:MAG TPA: alpha-amylase family glycosyl hydrolase [Melioribacteraceae bacterium]|nr:alpha-amylase family glycosyl hydrolase [Melioribacteraceae bacterium]
MTKLSLSRSVFTLLFFISFSYNITGEKLFVTERKTIAEQPDTSEFVKRYNELDRFYSDKKLGSFFEDGTTFFRLFAPSAVSVRLCTFTHPDSRKCKEYFMSKDENGVWEARIEGEQYGLFYGFKVYHKGEDLSNSNKPICVDPYSKAVATKTSYLNPRRSIVVKDSPFDWEGTDRLNYDWRDLIIYEMHVRDMTAHKSSGAKKPGTYRGLIEKGNNGGIDYIKALGINAVEILPAQEFGYCEIPFRDSLDGKFNTWNPYERNHWGYMTGAFFAPASYYSQQWKNFKWNDWIGKDGRQINDFKEMVKSFHKDGIAVIMDVVYNHLSEYEIGNLKQIDKEYYFRLDNKGNYIANSWCGNDLKTERPMVRRLIVESLVHWMKEYKVDGFRFDLSTLIDWKTVEEIRNETMKINPNVILIGEAWGGGGYSPDGFSKKGYAAWNDQIRNGIKGENPHDGLGWIFGEWYGNNSIKRIKSYVNATLVRDSLGLFQKKEHSVNYLESHDGYTLGDFIRLGTKEVDNDQKIKDIESHVKLSERQMKLNKLAALFLLTSQGITMIHAGQEFARSKVIQDNRKIIDPEKGRIDHNSYNKDNETNYINYKHAEINSELLNYYKGLIRLRKQYTAFRHAEYEEIGFLEHPASKFGLAFSVHSGDEKFIVLFNCDKNLMLDFPLPEGNWEVLVNEEKAGVETISIAERIYNLKPGTGAVLKRIKK